MAVTAHLTPTIRRAEPNDWRFLDQLQRRHHDALGFLSRSALGEAIARGRVLLALENGAPAGYVYGAPAYQRRADVAIVYQAAIGFDARRRLLGTALVEAFAARLPPPVRQVSLWCAADLDANLFWSALGFVAVAHRDGARSTGRTHLFWCRHTSPATPTDPGTFWVPEATRGGVMRAARAVTRLPGA